MLTTLATVKTRLSIVPEDTTNDAVLNAAIAGISARFDRECNRKFARTAGATYEFRANETHIPVSCYPIETVTKFEVKPAYSADWVEMTGLLWLVRARSVISLPEPILSSIPGIARVTYTGGYVLPGTTPGADQTALPADLEQAAVEQVVFWYQTRGNVGIVRSWPSGGAYIQYADPDLIPSVRAVLNYYTRITL